ncbi:uncharacterized protein LOC143226081 isoform X2 [Tachypleus tridentatus]|uniref:uncharacterized protein LOC143226081 isoform X2 n=1 Tax=Tachypleus tridentatus TaxID=6853 RepID=UPI003FCFDC2E
MMHSVLAKYFIVRSFLYITTACGLNQRGKTDEDGILGFFPSDILREVRRGKRLKCTYCGKYGATVGCCNKKCKKVFHFPCGLQNDSLSQFFGTYDTFCGVHRPRQEVNVKDGKSLEESDSVCSICLYSVDSKVSSDSLRAPCCNYSWFHRICVQRLALSAGYFFKCPLCNNKDLFNTEMLKYGIHIPKQDASWELEQNAFQDLLERYCHCDAIHCICPNGRNFSSKGSEWEIIICNSCGSQGCHALCKEFSTQPFSWMCSGCLAVTLKVQQKRLAKPGYPKIHVDEECIIETSEEDSSSTSTCMCSTVLPQKRSREETHFTDKDSVEFEDFKKENNDLTSLSRVNRRDKKSNGYKVKPVSLECFFSCSQRNEPVVSFEDGISNLSKNVNKGISFSEEKNSELFQMSSHLIDNELCQPEVHWKDSLQLPFNKNDSPQRCHNTWKDFNNANLASNKPIFYQINHQVNPGTFCLEIFMRQGGDKPPVELGFRNLFVPSTHSNHSKKQVSTVTLEQLLSNSVTKCNDKHQSNCSAPSREVKDFKSSSEKKIGSESTSKPSSSNSKNYLKESQWSRNVEHYHSASNHLAYNQGSKLQKPTNDHDILDYISPTSNSKMHPETKHVPHKHLSKDNRKQELHVSKVCDITISSSCDVQIIDKPADINCRLKCTAQSKCVSSDMNRFGDDSNTHCLSQDTAVDGNSVCGVASENEDQHCMATFQSIPANSTLTESVTTCIGTSGVLKTAKYNTNQTNLTVFEISNSISSVYDKDQPVIKPEEIGIFSSGIETQELTKVDKVDSHNTDKSTRQKHHSVCRPYKYARDIHGQDQPVMESQEVTIFHSEDETQQGTEEDKMKLQITEELISNCLIHLENSSVSTTGNLDLPQDVSLAQDSNKILQVTGVGTVELQKLYKPTNQIDCIIYTENNNNCTFQEYNLPIIVPQDFSLIHPASYINNEDRMESQNTNTSTGENVCVVFLANSTVSSTEDEDQPIIVPENISFTNYSNKSSHITEVVRMEIQRTSEPMSQNDCVDLLIQNSVSTTEDEDLPIIVSEDINLTHHLHKTPQTTETNSIKLQKINKSISQNNCIYFARNSNVCGFQNEDLPIIVPQNISLVHPAHKTSQITGANSMEIQVTNEDLRPSNPLDLRTPSPLVYEICSSDESDCVILSDYEIYNND